MWYNMIVLKNSKRKEDNKMQDKKIETEKPKRKTHTSSEVKQRYNKKTYTPYTANLRKKEDEDVIKLIEDEKAKGYGTTQAIKNLILKIK